jgi:purine-nucleoside/S-methyl-5'-thioadenosine phosphorylase / adenosine deaminase
MLPKPSGSFRWVQVDGRPALVCLALKDVAPHLFTTRHWPLGLGSTGDRTDDWSDVAGSMRVDVEWLVRVQQVHRADVVVHRRGNRVPSHRPQADIIISDDPAAALAVQAADCVPLLVADRRTGSVAAAHAGWRGLAAGVPRVTVEALARECGGRAADLVAAVGPSIGACCYEVGADVRQHFETTPFLAADLARWFHTDPQPTEANPSLPNLPAARREGHWYFDGWAAVRDGLTGAGVPADQIFVAELCTASHPGALCSYRRDGAPAGRMVGAIRPAFGPRP